MPSTSIYSGGLLILLGIFGYGYGLTTEKASVTALIPAFFGILMVIFGLIANSKENLRKHLMHASVLVALLGFLASGGRLLSKFSDISVTMAYVSQILMALICLIFVILSVNSFIAARKSAA
jgi:hypothetical protein